MAQAVRPRLNDPQDRSPLKVKRPPKVNLISSSESNGLQNLLKWCGTLIPWSFSRCTVPGARTVLSEIQETPLNHFL